MERIKFEESFATIQFRIFCHVSYYDEVNDAVET
jgi:hypothetical protein